MAETFREIIGKVMLHCSAAGAMLCRTWVEDGWLALNERRTWSHLRFQGNFSTSASRTGTCGVTNGDTLVTAVGLTFSSTDVGRQFRVGNGLPMTIIELQGADAVLDIAYAGSTDAAATGSILDAYITMPENFGRFIDVIDPVNQWRLHLWITEQELSIRDPARQYTQDPWALVNGTYSPVPGLEGRVRYELWPYSTGAKRYDYLGVKRGAPVIDTRYPDGPFRQRPDIVRKCALMAAASWKDPRNRYYDPSLANKLETQLNELLAPLERVDEEIYLTMLDTLGLDRMRWAPLDSTWSQAHDDVAGPGWGG